MTKKSTKRALLASMLALVVSISMLIGTTFAWFTDNVVSGRNLIQSGNLDVELEYYNGTAWVSVENATDIFSDELWEPGHAEVVYLKVSNRGSLALKYQLGINIWNETSAVNVYDEAFKLSDYILFDAIDIDGEADFFASREEAMKATDDVDFISAGYTKGSALEKNGEEYVALVVYMPTEVGNEANYKPGTTAPSLELGVKLVATQFTSESDSFGDDYDADATYIKPWSADADTAWYTADKTEYTLYTAEDLAGLAELVNAGNDFEGITVCLGSDIDLAGKPWTPIGTKSNNFGGTFDGKNFVISNLNVSGTECVGLIGCAGSAASIENVFVENATVTGNHYVGTVLGYGYLSQNSLAGCFVNNATVVCTPVNGDDGDKAGIVAGMAINGNIYNNRVANSKIYAYRDFGAIVGCAQAENRDIAVYANDVKKVEMSYVSCDNYAGGKANQNMGELVGRPNNAGKTVTVRANNTVKDVVKNGAEDSIKVATAADTVKVAKNETVYLAPGTYTNVPTLSEGSTIIGMDGVTLNATLSGTLNDTTIKNIEIKSKNAQRWAYAEGDLYFEDCTFEATSVYAIHYDGLTGANITYKNCKIVGWVAIGGGAEHITFDGCQIYGNGTYGLIRLYSPGTIKNCTFDVSAVNTKDVYQDGIHAVDCVIEVENNVNLNGAMADIYNTSGTGTIKEGDFANVSTEAGLVAALAKGENVVLNKDVQMEAAKTAPYGNKYAVALNGGVLDGNNNELYMECYGDDYGVMTNGGTIKNITITEGCRAVMIMYPQTDVIIDNAKIGGDGVLYPINTGEGGAAGVKLIVTNSTLAGWTSYGLIDSASFTKVNFEQGTYYNNIYGRVLKPYVNTTLTECSFVKSMNLDLSALKEGHKVVIKNCTVDGQAVTLDTFTVPSSDEEYDTALFSVDLPSWASSVADCIVIE